jgi:DNA-directed RNA polymerase specialized sigma24 family protein
VTFSFDLGAWARRVATALLIAITAAAGSAVFPSITAVYAAPSLSLKALCFDHSLTLDEVRTALRSRIRTPASNARYDDILSGVLLRVAKDCVRGAIPDSPADQEARLNTIIRNSRIDVQRRNKVYEFQQEVIELVPPKSDVSGEDILDVIDKRANSRQKIVFEMLAQGQTQQEIADHVGVSVGSVNSDTKKVKELLKDELSVQPQLRRRTTVGSTAPSQQPNASSEEQTQAPEKSMTRIKSPLGAEVMATIKQGAEVMPTGTGYAGEVMTVTIPSSHLSHKPVDGIVMLPTPIILKSDSAGEQEMVVTAVREIGEAAGKRTFALYAFCKDEALDVPSDLSRYSFKSAVSDSKITEIVTKGDYRQPEIISKRLWSHFNG